MPMLATCSSIALLSHTRTIATRSYMRQHIQESADKSGVYLIVKVEPFTWNEDDADRHSSQVSMKYGKKLLRILFQTATSQVIWSLSAHLLCRNIPAIHGNYPR